MATGDYICSGYIWLYMTGHVVVQYMWLLAAILAATGGYRWTPSDSNYIGDYRWLLATIYVLDIYDYI